MQIYIVLWMLLLSPYSIFSQHIYARYIPIQKDSGNHIIEIIGGNNPFIIKCLQSNLGLGNNETENIWIWDNIYNKEWSSYRCSISAECSFGSHPREPFGSTFPISRIEIKCRDKQEKDLLDPKIKSSTQIQKFIKDRIYKSIAIVNTPSGINIRKEPSLESPVIDKVVNNDTLIVLEQTEIPLSIINKKDTLKTHWVKVYINHKTKGYAAAAYLIPWDGIPPNQLDADLNLSISDLVTHKNLDCHSSNLSCKDTLNKYVKLQLVNIADYTNKKAYNKYAIDIRDRTLKAPDFIEYNTSYPAFYLPINGGKDSLYIHDHNGEFDSHRYSYAGKLQVFNQYAIGWDYFGGTSYTLYDVKTGQKTKEISDGFPYFSPDGKYIVDFIVDSDPESTDDGYTCVLNISQIDPQLNIQRKIQLTLDSWFPIEVYHSAFWVSNREIIIQALSRNSFFNRNFLSNRATERNEPVYQYIKLTILK